MANFCNVEIIGRLARDPVVSPGRTDMMIVYNPDLPDPDSASGSVGPVYIEIVAVDKEGGRRLATACSRLAKGEEHLFRGRISQKRWTENGRDRSKHYVFMDDLVILHQLSRHRPLNED